MPWFDPPATGADTALWLSPSGTGSKHIVGRWPHPNVLRTSSDYILEFTDDLSHVAYRRLFRMDFTDTSDPVTFPEFDLWGHWDVGIFQTGWLFQTEVVNSEGWSIEISIQKAENLPQLGVEGTLLTFHAEHPASGHFITQTYEYRLDTNSWRFDRDQAPDFLVWKTEEKSVDFPYLKAFLRDYAMSDCYLFPRAAAGPTAFASFNNLDASVIFDAFTTNTSNRWKLQFDVRLRDTDDCCVLGRTNNFSRRALLSSTRFLWFSVGTTIDPPLPLNEFGTVRVEWDWDTPGLFFNVWWNDVLRGTEPAFFANGLRFNVMGKSGATFVGDFDMLNLTLEDNNPGSPNLMLSTELQVDACDIGVKMLKGTTENMTLPSCP